MSFCAETLRRESSVLGLESKCFAQSPALPSWCLMPFLCESPGSGATSIRCRKGDRRVGARS